MLVGTGFEFKLIIQYYMVKNKVHLNCFVSIVFNLLFQILKLLSILHQPLESSKHSSLGRGEWASLGFVWKGSPQVPNPYQSTNCHPWADDTPDKE